MYYHSIDSPLLVLVSIFYFNPWLELFKLHNFIQNTHILVFIMCYFTVNYVFQMCKVPGRTQSPAHVKR